jgi:predicted AAA+ superfamily ATPase
MERSIFKDLSNWKNSKNRKPLILLGARQVGKTYLLKELFGKVKYKNVAYILMSDNNRMSNLFDSNNDARSLITGLEAEAGFSFDPENTLIFLDEIQEVPKAISALKYFYEQVPEYNIVTAGSLLGVKIKEQISFPVGKVNSLYLYPLSFTEFVSAVKSENLANLLQSVNKNLINSFHDEYIELLKQYFLIGGMPEVVKSFIETKSYFEMRKIQNQILSDYQNDFGKHAPNNIIPRIQMVFNSIPSQLAKENKKFTYNSLKKGARSKDYEIAIQWLTDAGILHKVVRINSLLYPIKHYEDTSSFKLFLVDVGLLSAINQVNPTTILDDYNIMKEFKGALTEQFTLQQLLVSGFTPNYYSNDNSKSEIDFVIQQNDSVIPIEVKAGKNLISKSLKANIEKYNIKQAIKFSINKLLFNENVFNIPLYLADNLKTLFTDNH